MIELEREPTLNGSSVFVQDEPALEITIPQVFEQPALSTLQRGKLPQVEALVAKIARRADLHPGAGLGPDYQALVNEFQPLFTWAMACWDFLLSTEGCRFVPRAGEQKFGVRGDYRAVTDKDYSRLVHTIFRQCVLEFAHAPHLTSLSHWLRAELWPRIVNIYQRMELPPDPRQRRLTPYSYLRCVPYRFLNDFHQTLVYSTARRLPLSRWQAVDAYFLHFYTEAATAERLGCTVEEGRARLREALVKLLVTHRLVYCLLRQIERY